MKKFGIWFLLMISPWVSFSQDLIFDGVILQHINVQQDKFSPNHFSAPTQVISLLGIKMSDAMSKKILNRVNVQMKNSYKQYSDSIYPKQIDLGMENVPVLNQGIHGACVTFAATAAIDAILKKGDYVSQLCSLQMGRYLQTNGYLASGWQGGLGASILSQLDAFGFMTKEMQQKTGCGGIRDYPLLQNELGEEMNLIDFHNLSESLVQNRIAWSNYIDFFQMMHDGILGADVLNTVKRTLNQGDRLIFGILLADYDKGLAGAVGTHKVFNDSWVLTPEIINDLSKTPQFAGHEMLIIGYDDDALAKDEHGREHQGLLKLRNSWGDRIGDHGDFYMSYDYFKALVIELQRIRKIQNKA